MNIGILQLKSIARKIRMRRCSVHDKKASVRIKNKEIELSNFCCDRFNEKLHAKTKSLMILQIAENEKEKAKKNAWRKF